MTTTARWRPSDVPALGQVKGITPVPGDCPGEPDAVAAGLADVGVVHEPTVAVASVLAGSSLPPGRWAGCHGAGYLVNTNAQTIGADRHLMAGRDHRRAASRTPRVPKVRLPFVSQPSSGRRATRSCFIRGSGDELVHATVRDADVLRVTEYLCRSDLSSRPLSGW